MRLSVHRSKCSGLFSAAVLVFLIIAAAGPGTPNRLGLPAQFARAAAGPSVTVLPQSGPPGSSVSLSAVGFDPSLAQKGLTADIVFDTGSLIDTQKLVVCAAVPGAAPTAGFGADCTGVAVMEQVPVGAQPGPQHLFIVRVGAASPSTPFSVTAADTATSTVTETVVMTATATLTPTDTLTPSPASTATATGTTAPFASSTPTATPTTAAATAVPSRIPSFQPIHGPLLIYRLVRTPPPLSFMLGQLRRLAPHPNVISLLDQHGAHLVAGYDGSRLAAYADLETGDSAFFPALPESGRTMAPIGRLVIAAQFALRASGLIPRDATGSRLAQPLLAGTLSSNHPRTARSTRLLFFPVTRLVGARPVYGPGSRAALVLGPDGSLRGYLRQWRTAVLAGSLGSMRPASKVLRSIQAQLAIVGAGSPVTLDSISVAYYDGNRSYLEPAYRFTATVHLNGAAVDHVIGYEPIAVGEPEPLPTLGPSVVVTSRSPGPADLDSDGIAQFVARGPMPTWSQDAQAFEQGILSFWPWVSGSVAVPFQVGSVSAPRPFTTAATFGAYANSARVLESEAPGSRGHFTTDRYCCGAVTIARIGGLGAAGRKANGLAFWIARTPSLVASPDDSTAPYNEWLSVFAGLHGVVGYRTDIYSNDGVAGPFGADLAMGAPVVSAWLLEGAATSAYRGGENPLYEGSSGGLRAAPSGRVSTLSVCGHDGDTMHDTASLPRTTCLQSWWLEE